MENTFTQRNTIAATKSLRPHEFARDTYSGEISRGDMDRYLAKVVPVLQKGTFFQVHSIAQVEHMERFKFQQDKVC